MTSNSTPRRRRKRRRPPIALSLSRLHLSVLVKVPERGGLREGRSWGAGIAKLNGARRPPLAGRGTMFSLPTSPQPQPYSPDVAAKTSRLRGATVTESVCPYCAVGCGQLIYTKAGKLIDIEG